MPRLPRLDLPGNLFHLMVRGVEKRSIFMDDSDRQDFLARLAMQLAATGSMCFAWSLMTNHLHLLILTGARGLASLMQPVLTGYVGAFNRKYGRVGHLVQNRFKAILCDADAYFQELMRYIHLNPVRAGIVKSIEDLLHFPWTGHPALMGAIKLPWQAVPEALRNFGSTEAQAQKNYLEHLKDGWNQGRRLDLEGGGLVNSHGGLLSAVRSMLGGERELADPRILGDGAFVERILREADEIEKTQKAFERSELSMFDLQTKIKQVTGVDAAEYLRPDRSAAVSQARSMFIFGATEWFGRNSSEMAELLHMSSSSVSAARRRGQRLEKTSELKAVFGPVLENSKIILPLWHS